MFRKRQAFTKIVIWFIVVVMVLAFVVAVLPALN